MTGYRTYVMLIVALLKLVVLPVIGIQIPDADLDKAVDVMLLMLIGLFRYLATRSEK